MLGSALIRVFKWAAVATMLAATVQAAAAAEVVTFSLLSSSSTLPYFLAYDQKMFEAEGIEPKHVFLGAPNQVIDSFLTGRSDVGPNAAAGITIVANAQFPGTLKVFGFQGGSLDPFVRDSALVVRNSSSATSFADMKGKKIGTLPGIQWRSITRNMLRKAGLNPETDAQIVEVGLPLQIQALLSGTVDALLAIEPTASLAVATGQAKVALENPTDRFIGTPFFNGAMVMTTKFAETRPEVAKKVVKVMVKATRMVNDDYEKYKPLLAKYGVFSTEALVSIPLGMVMTTEHVTEADLDSYQKFSDMFLAEKAIEVSTSVRDQMLAKSYFPQ
jgi:NitT/TauT family transport system substrate-binding protein